MPGSKNYAGNPAIFNRHVELERDREVVRKRAEERLAQAIRDASPIVTPPVRRTREATTKAPPTEPTVEAAPSTEKE